MIDMDEASEGGYDRASLNHQFCRAHMKILSTLLHFALILSASGCSLLYDIGQDADTSRCNRMKLIEDRNACLKRIGPNFEQYERDREKLKRGVSEKPNPPGRQ